MTRRATFTQAELVRAIRAAEAAGKVARWTPGGIVFVDPGDVPHDAPAQGGGGNSCDAAFGTGARRGGLPATVTARQWSAPSRSRAGIGPRARMSLTAARTPMGTVTGSGIGTHREKRGRGDG